MGGKMGMDKMAGADGARELKILGVRVLDMTIAEAMAMMERWIRTNSRISRRLYIVNTHSLNLAYEHSRIRDLFNSADAVFGDGTGVRWAARLQGIRIQDNLNGTDLMPAFLQTTAGRGYRYYLLGADAQTIVKTAAFAREHFTGWDQVGFHHGYLGSPEESAAAVERINAARPDMLLVGMGQPRQEQWLYGQRDALRVPLCIGVGGLFDHWGGNLRRASPWVRRLGFEWLQLLLQQPHKFRRYVIGNPKFLLRIGWEALGGGRSNG